MPVFIRPARVEITEGGGIAGLILADTAVAAVAAVVAFVVAHLLPLAVCAVVLAGGTAATVHVLRRYIVPRQAPRATGRQLAAGRPVRAIPAAQPRAIAPPAQHLHIHLQGVDPADAAALLRRALDAGEPDR